MIDLLDWIDDAEDAVREHYSTTVYQLDMAMLELPPEQPAEEFAVEYDAEPTADTVWGKSVQSLPPVATLASAENLCRTHQVGADLLDVRTLQLRHRLDNRGLLIPISKEGT